MIKTDILIIGASIMGLSIARELHHRHPELIITLIEKEDSPGRHASGRNSGILHAGFYYTPDSLKAKFTVEGNRLLTAYCLQHNLPINRCGKVVVAKDEEDLKGIYELKNRGDKNGVELQIIDEQELSQIDPNARTYCKAIHSPATSVVNPKEVLNHIASSFKKNSKLLLNEKFIKREGLHSAVTNKNTIHYRHLINCAGLYADKIGHQYGVGKHYTLIPFKGLYIEYKDSNFIQKHIYPVPNLKNPFLGVHFTKMVDGRVKMGPTAIPVFWRENYEGLSNFHPGEFFEILRYEAKLFLMNSFNFRDLAFAEIKKHYKKYFIKQAAHLVKKLEEDKFGDYLTPGIRAQLLDTRTMKLEMDFVVEQEETSTHILNAVSPAFTSSFSFSKFIADKVEKAM
ncbi:L-2-hydroxyglutarate oxidase [uncultured Candidatus Kuenenia sp.]|uniref:L-2-hydroxyglutarate oxidase n=1 Tax=uncultured Candidatus Kuenenia sp. TaxID=1048336 RepID=UPI000317E4E0|nr:L-2-hydroxyglutarate oxidase [uncultured Candidatus Kuenenia sp.]